MAGIAVRHSDLGKISIANVKISGACLYISPFSVLALFYDAEPCVPAIALYGGLFLLAFTSAAASLANEAEAKNQSFSASSSQNYRARLNEKLCNS
jgi:hypothetical protein